ncbi:MAG: YcjF family protein [Gammaproteobacteria bacterium]|nr:YcjF family protein [Gammaproteobacteria bacterium]
MSETELVKSENSLEDAQELVRKSMYASMAAGLVPVPIFDFVAVTGIQIEMIRRLSHIYGIKFMEEKGKKALGALIGGSFPSSVAPIFAGLTKMVPVIGTTVGALSLPLVAGASTYAVGKVFIQHFESGGTFLTFDPEQVREYYSEQYKEGKSAASSAKKATT